MSGAAAGSDSDVECPTCGRTDFKNELGVKRHHARTHGESIAYETVQCANCGDGIQKQSSELRKSDNTFCRRECKNEWQSENVTGEDHPLWDQVTVQCTWCGDDVQKNPSTAKKYDNHFCGDECNDAWLSETRTGEMNTNWVERITVRCANCGSDIQKTPLEVERCENHFCDKGCKGEWQSEHITGEDNPNFRDRGVAVQCANCGDDIQRTALEVERYENHFCGRECRSQWRSAHWTGKDSPLWERVTVQCTWCGDDIQKIPSMAKMCHAHFCDAECRSQWRSERMSGDSNPSWNGGLVPYGEGWTEEKRETVRDRHDRECAGCGIHENELPQRLDVHHIVKARTFDNSEQANALDNLVALCRSCHRTWEQMSPLRPEIEQ